MNRFWPSTNEFGATDHLLSFYKGGDKVAYDPNLFLFTSLNDVMW